MIAWVALAGASDAAAATPISLEAAVAEQLAFENRVACAQLLAAGGEPTGALGTFCSREYPTDPGGGPGTGAGPGSGVDTVTAASRDTRHADVAITERWSLFLNLEHASSERIDTPLESGYDASGDRLQVGIGYTPSADSHWALALTHDNQRGDFSAGGDFANQGTGIQLIGSLLLPQNLSVDLTAGYEQLRKERLRFSRYADVIFGREMFILEGTPEADYNAGRLAASTQLNHDVDWRGWSLQATVGIDWQQEAYDTYRESGGSGLDLRFHQDRISSLQTRAGFSLQYALSVTGGALLPQTSVTWHHEWEDDMRSITVSFVDDLNATRFRYQVDAPEQEFLTAGIGLVWVAPAGWQGFLYYDSLRHHGLLDSDTVSAGIRKAL